MSYNVLLVTFSLNNPLRNYEQFFVTLRGTSIQWWHYIPQTCIVVTTLNLDELAFRLGAHIEGTDSLLIVPIGPDSSGQLPMEAWNWINQVTGSNRRPSAGTLPERAAAASVPPRGSLAEALTKTLKGE